MASNGESKQANEAKVTMLLNVTLFFIFWHCSIIYTNFTELLSTISNFVF